MLTNVRNLHTCNYGRKCCDLDGRIKVKQRRTVRRREAQSWLRIELAAY